jgi:hypothetical protein
MPGRINTVKRTLIGIITCSCLGFSWNGMAGESANIGADDALSRLLTESRRFVAGKSNEPTGPALIESRHSPARSKSRLFC